MRFQLLLISFLLSGTCFSQNEIRWVYSYNSTESQVEFKAILKDGWHVYSQFVDMEFGPVPTSFKFNENEKVQFINHVIEPEPLTKYDETFEAELSYFENEVIFAQKIKAKNNTSVAGTLTFMVCNETMCLPPKDEVFIIQIEK